MRDAICCQRLPEPLMGFGCIRRMISNDFTSFGRCTGLGSLREIGELIDLRTSKVDACESVRELLNHKVSDIRGKLRELQRLETELVADLEKCNKELKHRQRHEACACPVLEEVTTK